MQKIDPKKLSIEERVEKLNDMIAQGQILEAFEKFYAENITRQEINKRTTRGKDACRKIKEEFVTGISHYRKAIAKNVITSNNMSVVEWEFDYSHEEWGEFKFNQVIKQIWNCDGQIIDEFIYINN